MKHPGYVISALAALLLAFGAACLSCDNADEKDTTAAGPGDSQPRPAPSDSGTGTGTDTGTATDEDPTAPPAASTYVSGTDVYKAANCEMCHGKELQGSRLAPPLANLTANWDKDKLAAYLVDPEGYTENDPRLKANAGQYSLPMPAWKQTGLGEADMHVLIDWLLERK